MNTSTTVNIDLLKKVNAITEKNLLKMIEKILHASAEQGPFGVAMIEAAQAELPKTECANCGSCCNSISIFSIEYHRIMRDLMTRYSPDRLKLLIRDGLDIEKRFAVTEETDVPERRIRCVFRNQDAGICTIHPVRPFPCRLYGILKFDGTRECKEVRELSPWKPLKEETLDQLQVKIAANSEQHQVFPDSDEISFFPFEFWLFRYSLGIENALKIYREVIIPSSTPLIKLWK
ncbi:MAG: YkgJ family cysteine cluster protein [Candidatus Riflebacteria bacterium]|nr:YkgJ family cysteine cluster protein [Candidatus Riflebacteria bacterium]